MKRKITIGTIAFIVLYAIFGGDSNEQKNSNLDYEIKDKQKEFVTLIDSMRSLYLGEENQLKLTNIRKQRKAELRKMFKNRNVNDWKGKISSLTTGSDQKAYVEIKLYGSRNITIENNSLLGEGIAGNTETYNNLSELKVGDFVNFSGRFMYDSLENKDYLDEWSTTEYGSMDEPEFRFVFKSIVKYTPIEKSNETD